jgi:hypothetical protein
MNTLLLNISIFVSSKGVTHLLGLAKAYLGVWFTWMIQQSLVLVGLGSLPSRAV